MHGLAKPTAPLIVPPSRARCPHAEAVQHVQARLGIDLAEPVVEIARRMPSEFVPGIAYISFDPAKDEFDRTHFFAIRREMLRLGWLALWRQKFLLGVPVNYVYLYEAQRVPGRVFYHACPEWAVPFIQMQGLLPGESDRTDEGRFDILGNVYFSRRLGAIDDDTNERWGTAHAWRFALARKRPHDADDMAILRLRLPKESGLVPLRDPMSPHGVVISTDGALPAAWLLTPARRRTIFGRFAY